MPAFEGRRLLFLDLDGQPFQIKVHVNVLAAGETSVFVYGSPSALGLDAFATRLTATIQARWPDFAPQTGP
jgi:hypothetical protein